MGFMVGTQSEKLQEKTVNGHLKKVAVDCWFTSEGRTMPRFVKYEDEDGCRQILNDIEVIKSNQKLYAGITVQRYDCRAIDAGKVKEFVLLFHPGKNTWDMVIKDHSL